MGKPKKNNFDERIESESIDTPKSSLTKYDNPLPFLKKLNGLKFKVDHIKKYLNKFNDISEIPTFEIKVRLSVIEELKVNYDELIDEITEIPDEMKFKFENFFDNFDIFTIEWQSLLGQLRDASNVPVTLSENKPILDSPSTKPVSRHHNLFVPKLPEPKIQHFSGDQSQWLAFKETFRTIIHDNPEISDVVKFTYLLDKLKGDAKSCIGHVIFTSAGYQKAWQALCDRYDDKRSIVDVHINAILNLPRIFKENSTDLSELLNLCISHVSSLEASELYVDKLSELLLINIVLNKLSSNLKMEWEKEVEFNKIPSWKQFLDFITRQCRILKKSDENRKSSMPSNFTERNSSYSSKPQYPNKPKPSTYQSSTFLSNTSSDNDKSNESGVHQSHPWQTKYVEPGPCRLCNDQRHWLYMCPNFLKMDTHSRFENVKKENICLNCLRSKSHGSKICPVRGCKICNNKHHTLLHHLDPKSTFAASHSEPIASTSKQTNPSNSSQNFHAQTQIISKQIILSTAIVLVSDKKGKFHECRALLDNASTSNYITDSFATKLNLVRETNPTSSFGINNTKTRISEKAKAYIKSRTSPFEMNLEFNIVSTISESLPQSTFNISRWTIPEKINLADPGFNLARPVDMLIGGERFFDLFMRGKIVMKQNQPHFQQTVFGWICVGSLIEEAGLNFHLASNEEKVKDNELNESLRHLFDIDRIPDRKFLSDEERYCENYFSQTVSRDDSGRYIVSLPLKDEVKDLGESMQRALNRFQSLERKLNLDPSFKKQYSDVISDYLEQGHMKPIDCANKNEAALPSYYLPHHAVIKPSSSTTKLRVVFDASAKTSSNLSLNDVMYTGPTVQQSCFEIILRFRKYKFVFTSDVNKMYRQVKVNPQQTSLQRILWRDHPNDTINIFELERVTFGTAPAPYLATRALKQLAMDEREKFPEASVVVQRDFYVDDVLSGADNLEKAIQIQGQLKSMLLCGGFKLHKWSSNDKHIIENIPLDERENLKSSQESSDECLKTLGLIWIPEADVFKFNIPTIDEPRSLTKRTILSDIARLYDPLGLLAPIIITAKIFVQGLWKLNLDWDDLVPPEVADIWNLYRSELLLIHDVKLQRRVLIDNPKIIQLHGFSDASEKGYGACIYIRSVDQHLNCSVQLLCSKSRVAPIKVISLPRLELCAALLLSRLVNDVISTIDINFDDVYLWSDSTITLAWIQTSPHKLKTFIANRVNEIQELTVSYCWNHVDTSQNSADLLTRGVMPSELNGLDMWWNGLQILYGEINTFNSNVTSLVVKETENNDFELKRDQVTMLNIGDSEFTLLEKFSSYTKLIRVTAYCLRFIHNLKSRSRLWGNLSNEEINSALIVIVKVVQQKDFASELRDLKKEKPISRSSSILSLNPFLDSNGVLRVGGRLNQSTFEYDFKHQILLSANSHFTTLVFRHYHLKNLHAGQQLLVSLVRQKFWTVTAKNLARKCVRSCIPCYKVKPQIQQQIMGDLPAERVTPARPFYNTGVDLCGPFFVKNKRQRNSANYKVYVAAFVCFVSKGLHLEILSDLSTECFLACLRRFIYRRGKPHCIWSDNATNFVGARNELKRWHQMFKDQTHFIDIEHFCTSEEINWRFIPPRAPNFGGLWEGAVKSLKTHLKRVASNNIFTYEELHTLIVQIEGILNSRPLTALSSDPNDPEPLTPAHFLIGGNIVAPAEPSCLDVSSNRLTSWHKINQMVQHFWKRFSVEYVHSLQQRTKWKSSEQNLKIDDLVLVCDDNLPSTKWMLGIIVEIYPGQDGRTRVALIKTRSGLYKRAISKLCRLPLD